MVMSRQEKKRFDEVERVVNELKKMFGLRDKKIGSVFYLIEIIQKQEESNIKLDAELMARGAALELHQDFLTTLNDDMPKKFETWKKERVGIPPAPVVGDTVPPKKE